MNTAASGTLPQSAALQLLGRTLDDGWRVVEHLYRDPADPNATGGFFSQGYVVERGGERAFLKALDYSKAFRAQPGVDPARVLSAMTEAFNFERDILQLCQDRRMRRIVRVLAEGTVVVPGSASPGLTQYLIFELADGDMRRFMARSQAIDLAWTLRMLQHVANALDQLHGADMAHQDLKPSNVLTFEGGLQSKLGDLGRSACKTRSASHDAVGIAGDRTYAPLEQLYGVVPSEWNARRVATDAYHLGSLILFAFAQVATTPAVLSRLDPAHLPKTWSGAYVDVLPYLRAAFEEAMLHLENQVPAPFRGQIVAMVRQLCDPDPNLRGHPKNRRERHGNPYRLRRYVTELDVLARKAEAGLKQ